MISPWGAFINSLIKNADTVKVGFKERLDKEQLDNSEPFPVTNNLINSEQIGFSEQLCNSQKVPYYQV